MRIVAVPAARAQSCPLRSRNAGAVSTGSSHVFSAHHGSSKKSIGCGPGNALPATQSAASSG